MKKTFLLLAVLLWTICAFAQTPAAYIQRNTPTEVRVLKAKEDSLKTLAKSLLSDTLTAKRMRADSLFIRTLVRALQVKNSFYYPFSKVQGIGKVYAPDSTFRIITWNLYINDYYSRQRGAIQFKTADGSLKLVPLRDFSEFSENPLDSVRGKDNWIGAVYYNMVKTEYKGKPYYTLFGFDEHSVRSNRKWIEVLTFNERNQPQFGGPFFSFEQDTGKRRPTQFRYYIEYKKEASTIVNFVPDENMILFDHLISETDEPDNPYTYIPDGDYEGFKWQDGKWVHVDKVFNFKIDMKNVDPYLGNPPVGDPILDKEGNRDEKKLMEKSDKNKGKKKEDEE
ncbi:MAG: hypothetical protein C4330_00930 [Chitinophagaceae bacterium]